MVLLKSTRTKVLCVNQFRSLKTVYDEIKKEEANNNAILKKKSKRKEKKKTKDKFFGEFDPGSGLTLAACLIHASRMVAIPWRTGE